MSDTLTPYQRDLIAAIAANVSASGQDLMGWIEDHTEREEAHHGSVYPALDDLVERGLVTKSNDAHHARANVYELTVYGKRKVETFYEAWSLAFEGIHGGEVSR